MEKVVDFSLQVFRLTNNFYFHFPGGWYRDLKKDCGSMYEDMDLIIKEKGYVEKDLELIPVQQTENNLKEKRASIIMSVFVEMIKKGYDEKEL